MAGFVSVHFSGGLATIRLDRPPVNALSIALQSELRDAAEQVSVDPDIRAAVIDGGEKVFAAGADVTEMAGRNYAEMAAISRRLHASFRAVAAIGKPVVAAITGVALGGGLEVERLHFAALFATEDQKLGMESFLASGPGKATFAGT